MAMPKWPSLSELLALTLLMFTCLTSSMASLWMDSEVLLLVVASRMGK
jgi:hypothetical protein